MNKIYVLVAIVVGIAVAFFTSGALIALCGVAFWLGAGVYLVGRDALEQHALKKPETQEQLERDWWTSDKELPEPPPEINWDEFERAIDIRLQTAQDPWAVIDVDELLKRADRDMNYVWPDNAEWACPNCNHRFSRPLGQCPLCEHETTIDEFKPAAAEETDHKSWKCGVCQRRVPRTFHRCNYCANGFRGGGPYRQEVFDGPDGPTLETIYVDPKSGDKTIVSSRRMDSSEYETITVAESGKEYVTPVGTSRHGWAGGTDFSDLETRALAAFQVPPHMMVSQPERHHISYSRPESLRRQIEAEVRKGRMTPEQARVAIQLLHERG